MILFPRSRFSVGAFKRLFCFCYSPSSAKSISSLIDSAFFPLLNVTKINKRKALFHNSSLSSTVWWEWALKIVFRKSLQFTMTTVINVFERRFNGLFWIAFDFFLFSQYLPPTTRIKRTFINSPWLFNKESFLLLFFGTQINVRFFSPYACLFFLIIVCLLIERNKSL